MELDSCERTGNDLHDLLYSSLNKSNTEEVLDVFLFLGILWIVDS